MKISEILSTSEILRRILYVTNYYYWETRGQKGRKMIVFQKKFPNLIVYLLSCESITI